MGNMGVMSDAMNATFDSAKTGFELSLGLTGVMTLWLGLMRVGEQGGVVEQLSKLVRPLFKHLMPGVPAGHKAQGSIMMNIAANMLGLDNAATPLGLKAMEDLQELNPDKERASNAQIMFLVLNTSGLTVIPISIMAFKTTLGSENPTDIFIPILLTTFCSTMAGLIAVAIVQQIKLHRQPIVWAYLGGASVLIASLVYGFARLDQATSSVYAGFLGNLMLFGIIIWFILAAVRRKVNVYESFIEGAKNGFNVAIKIIPYLVGILVAIGVFRASGAMNFIENGITWIVESLGLNSDFVPAIPTAIMKPLSGGGARGMMAEAMNHYGVDSFVGKVAATLQGSTETTFYVLAVYFGSVGVKNTRHALGCGLIADFTGIIAAILLSYLFFH